MAVHHNCAVALASHLPLLHGCPLLLRNKTARKPIKSKQYVKLFLKDSPWQKLMKTENTPFTLFFESKTNPRQSKALPLRTIDSMLWRFSKHYLIYSQYSAFYFIFITHYNQISAFQNKVIF